MADPMTCHVCKSDPAECATCAAREPGDLSYCSECVRAEIADAAYEMSCAYTAFFTVYKKIQKAENTHDDCFAVNEFNGALTCLSWKYLEPIQAAAKPFVALSKSRHA